MMSSKSKQCSGCLTKINNKDCMTCSLCKDIYDLNCANISTQRFNTFDKDKKEKWVCPGCRNKERKRDNTNTPVHSRSGTQDMSDTRENLSSPDVDNITQRKKSHQSQSSSISALSLDESLLSCIRSEIQASVQKSLNQAIMESPLMKELQYIKEELNSLKDLKNGMEFLSREYDSINEKVINSEEKIKSLSRENNNLCTRVEELSNRLILLEQHSRETNIEVNGVPESKSENLMTVARKICNIISVPTEYIEAATCTRVRKMNETNNRPRAIIIKLSSTRARDEILAAVTKFNKKNISNKLNTEHLGFREAKSPVYVSEHLTPFFKALHARTRQVAREKEYKFVWVRNGRIFVRKNDQSTAKQIKCYDSLNNL